MATSESLIQRFRRRVALLAALSRGVRYLALWCFVWGGVVLALRAGFDTPREWLFWGLAGVLPALAAAAVLAWRGRPSARSVRALLDLHNRRGGLMMAAAEVELGGWRGRIGEEDAPRLRGRSRWGLLAGGAAFAVAALWMPVVPSGLEDARPLEIGEEVGELAERIEVLKEEGLLEENEAERFEAELEALEEEASGDDPAATWEALDHLQEMTDRTAEEVAEAALAEGEQLAAAEMVAEALSENGDLAGEELLNEAMAELSALTERTAAESRLLENTLAAELAAGSGSQMDLGELRDALGRGKGSLDDKLDRLYASGLIDLETLLAAKSPLDGGDLDSLERFLEENGLEASKGFCKGGRPGPGSRFGEIASGAPGRGGINRGRADAAMTWKDPSSRDGAEFEELILDPSSLAALRESQLLGLTVADPSALEPGALPGAGTAIDAESVAGGGAAYTHTLLPRHRGAVKRYFDRPAEDP
ncbi:MAG: hypothetical protein GY719_11320 [bacterium]|nr:hypothetical protein [bacterium]